MRTRRAHAIMCASFALFLGLCSASANAACRQALALGLDVSGSVDSREYRLQLDGLANALVHPEVAKALLSMAETPVALAVYEWSGPTDQRIILPWREVTDTTTLTTISDTLRNTKRAPLDPSTAIGSALRFGIALLGDKPMCWKRTLDISGDGKSNTGPDVQTVQRSLPPAITVNGLVIGADTLDAQDRRMMEIGELISYYGAVVISGPDAFVESALGFDAFEAAMVRKLKRELQGIVIGQLR